MMKTQYDDDFERNDHQPKATRRGHNVVTRFSGAGLFDQLPDLWQMDELAAEIGQEGQARVVFAGLPGVGKRTLFNHLRGGLLDWEEDERIIPDDTIMLEPFGSFVLADFPAMDEVLWQGADALLMTLGDPALVVYLLSARRGITQADYRWISALRSTGRPVLIALNKIDQPERAKLTAAAAEGWLGMPVVPVSALAGTGVDDVLLPAMLSAVPKLAVILGREVTSLRRTAAWRLTRQSAFFAAIIGAQPFPGLDIPVLALTHIGLVMRMAAVFGRPMSGISKEAVAIVGSVMAVQYAIQTAVKTVPVIGSLAGSVLSATSTCVIGAVAMRTYSKGRLLPRVTWQKPRWLRLPKIKRPQGKWWRRGRQL